MGSQEKQTFRRIMGIAIFVIAVLLLLLLALAGYSQSWTGFGKYADPKGEFQREKTFWDWMDLLIVPLVLAGGAYYLARSERAAEGKIASDRLREGALQAYFDHMTQLLLEKGLRSSEQGTEVQSIARVRTLTVLRTLDGTRKGMVIRFLYESNLIRLGTQVVHLRQADLTGANLSGAFLEQANLVDADLSRANLSDADLNGAALSNLSGANLIRATLIDAYIMDEARLASADLRETNLSKAHLDRADLRGANLSGAHLHTTHLNDAELCSANLREANLYGANLRGAKLKQANLSKARLSYTDLSDANLQGVKRLTNKQLVRAGDLRGATMMDGSRYDGRFNLIGDISTTRKQNLNPDDAEAMARFYGVSLEGYQRGQEWARENLPKLRSETE